MFSCALTYQLYPLEREYEDVMGEIEESLGNLYLYQLRQNEAAYWYHRALDAVSEIIDSSLGDAADLNKLMETKGKHLILFISPGQFYLPGWRLQVGSWITLAT